ncbi:alpha-expansin precursor family protein [Salix suchowensis]|nr:alpha-expansin precursor family protein [Salix suchowensis]
MGALKAILLYFILYQTWKIAADEEEWKSATATYVKETSGSIIVEGACGYGDLHRATYGKYGAGLSSMLFNRGSTCGVCFEVRCVDHILWCLQGSPSVILTATDFCSPNYGLSSEYGGWCNFPKEHFEMSEAAFAEIAEKKADIVPVQHRSEGIKTAWIPMARNWGQNWQSNINLVGQPLSFEVTTSRRRTLTSYNVAPANWQFGQIFEGKQF